MNISHPETLISRNTQKYRVWQKTFSLLLCALLVFSYLPFSNIALTTRELASIKGSGLGEAADESASYMSVTSTAPVISDAGVAQDAKDAPVKDSPATGTEPSTDTTYPPIASKAPAEEAPPEEELPPADDQQQDAEHAPGPSVDSVVMQSTAYTCGPAALATLLKMISGKSDYYRQIIDMAGTDNSGTSLLALKRSAEALGYEAAGLRLGIEGLAAAGPVLAHVVIGGYHHFTVVEGIADGSVFLADPQLGRVNIPAEQFKSVWNGTVLKVSEARAAKEASNTQADDRINEQQAPETPTAEGVTATTNTQQQEATSVPENTGLLYKNLDGVKIPETHESTAQQNTKYIKTPTASSSDTLSEIKVERGQLNALTEEEMRGTWGKGLPILAVKVGVPLAIRFGPKAVASITAGAKHGQRIVQIAHHSAHHKFRQLGGKRLPHIQGTTWRAGVKNSGKTLFRIPLPSRFVPGR